MFGSVVEAVMHYGKQINSKTVLITDRSRITYGELGQKIRMYAACLSKYGIKSGDKVILAADHTEQFIELYFAIHWLGAVSVPVEKKVVQKYHPKMLYTIPNFHNPTGITTSVEKRRKIYDICAANNILILEDNPYGEICFGNVPLPLIKSFDSEGIVILAQSLSKIIAPGLRVSACIANKKIVQKFVLAKRCTDVHTSTWGQYICEQILSNKDMGEHVKKLCSYYKSKCNIMLDEIVQKFPDDIRLVRPQGGMFMWVTLPERFSMPNIVEMALKQNVAVVPGNIFLVNQNEACQSIRMNYSTPSTEDIKKAISIIGKILCK